MAYLLVLLVRRSRGDFRLMPLFRKRAKENNVLDVPLYCTFSLSHSSLSIITDVKQRIVTGYILRLRHLRWTLNNLDTSARTRRLELPPRS